MNLTTKQPAQRDRQTQVFSFTPPTQSADLYPYQLSCSNDTQLLDPSIVNENSSFCISAQESFKKPFVLKMDAENNYFCDLSDQFQFTNRYSDLKEKSQFLKGKKMNVESICQELVKIIQVLQAKIDKLQQASCKIKSKQSLSTVSDESSTRKSLLQSISKFTNCTGMKSSMQGQGQNHDSDNFLQVLLQLIEAKGQIKIYKQQSQKIQRQMIDLRIENEENKRGLKKMSVQNMKQRELLKQYKLYHKNKNAQQTIERMNKNLDNSLEKRLKNSKKEECFSSLQRTNYYNVRQTPKTPNNIGYHLYKNSFNTEKTKARQHYKSESSFIKQIIQFSSKVQQNEEKYSNPKEHFLQKLSKKEINEANHHFYQKYPFNELLEMEDLNDEKVGLETFKIDHFSTMESLPELSQQASYHKQKQQDSRCFKKYIPQDR